MDLKSAKKIIKKVQKDYDLIAKEWDITRAAPRPFQIKLLKKIRKGSKILDVGCGNAVLYDFLAQKSINYVGLDVSEKLLFLAQKRISKIKNHRSKVKLVKGNLIKLPFRDKQFDWVLAFAALHHIPSKELQTKAIQEIFRVLRPGGRVIATVWNLYSDYAQERFKIKEYLKHRPAGWGENDLLTPWKATPGKVIQRYLYRFNKKEFLDLFKKAGFRINKIGYHIYPTGQWTRNINKAYQIVLLAQKKNQKLPS